MDHAVILCCFATSLQPPQIIRALSSRFTVVEGVPFLPEFPVESYYLLYFFMSWVLVCHSSIFQLHFHSCKHLTALREGHECSIAGLCAMPETDYEFMSALSWLMNYPQLNRMMLHMWLIVTIYIYMAPPRTNTYGYGNGTNIDSSWTLFAL